ncbi:MAG: hypothetical protein K0Q72_71 [Armatimonadetes bacterium]|nr:hypothetical protein [Armatimonadota bacterium]
MLPDCAFVLELTICLNRETLNRLEHLGGDPFPRRHFLQHDEKHAVAQSVACRTGFEAFGR